MYNDQINFEEAFCGKSFYPEWSEHLSRFVSDFDEVLGQYVNKKE